MSFRSAAVAALLAMANGHMIMQSPVPYSVDKIDSAPITAEQFPCKSNLGYTVSTMNKMAVGSKQTLSFKGSAVHGGGSCQLSVTTDTEPTKNSVFKVIKTMEGGCPGIDGPSTFDFELPDSIPSGKGTFAWTWFAKLSGGPEMYMNCAPIEVTGGASDKTKFNALPDMLVANIATSTCKSPTSKVLKIPNPGSVLQKSGSDADIVDGTGDCGKTGSTPSDPSSPAQPSSPTSGQPSSSPSNGQPSAAPSAPANDQPSAAPSAPGADTPSKTATPPAASSPGGVFAPGASSAAGVGPTGAPVPVPSTMTTLVTVTGKPAMPTGTAPATPPSTPASPPTSGSACTTNGAVVCNGEKKFGLCDNGKVVFQDVAAGTACVNGVISKRSFYGRVARARL